MSSAAAFAVVILMCAVILLLAWLASRFLGKTWRKTSNGRYIKVLDQVAVGQDRYLMIVKIHEDTYLVGSTGGEINLLTRLEGDFKEEESSSIYTHFSGREAKENFAELLKDNFKKYTGFSGSGKDVKKK